MLSLYRGIPFSSGRRRLNATSLSMILLVRTLRRKVPGHYIQFGDVGALGGLDVRWKELAPVLRVTAYEPHPDSAKSISAALHSVGSSAPQETPYRLIEAAVGAESGWLTLRTTGIPGLSSVLEPHANEELWGGKYSEGGWETVLETSVREVSLDDEIQEGRIQPFDFLKVDIEGFELRALFGYSKHIRESKFVQVETSFESLREGDSTFHEVDLFLRDMGFRLIDLRTLGPASLPLKGRLFDGIGGFLVSGEAVYINDELFRTAHLASETDVLTWITLLLHLNQSNLARNLLARKEVPPDQVSQSAISSRYLLLLLWLSLPIKRMVQIFVWRFRKTSRWRFKRLFIYACRATWRVGAGNLTAKCLELSPRHGHLNVPQFVRILRSENFRKSYSSSLLRAISPKWTSGVTSNPAILKTQSGAFAVVASNHNHMWSSMRDFRFVDGGPSYSRLIRYDLAGDWEPKEAELLPLELSDDVQRSDCRCVLAGDSVRLSYSYSSSRSGTTSIFTSEFNSDWQLLSREKEIASPSDAQIEKNWMPISPPWNPNQAAYLYSPTEQGGRDTAQAHFLECRFECQTPAEHLNGGTPLVRLPDGRGIAVVHSTLHRPIRNYLHYWLYGDLNETTFRVSHISEPFCFKGVLDAEFATGLVLHDNHLVGSFGFRNSQCWLFQVPLESVLTHLHVPVKY